MELVVNLRAIQAADLGEQLAVMRAGGLGGVLPSKLAFSGLGRGALMWTSSRTATGSNAMLDLHGARAGIGPQGLDPIWGMWAFTPTVEISLLLIESAADWRAIRRAYPAGSASIGTAAIAAAGYAGIHTTRRGALACTVGVDAIRDVGPGTELTAWLAWPVEGHVLGTAITADDVARDVVVVRHAAPGYRVRITPAWSFRMFEPPRCS